MNFFKLRKRRNVISVWRDVPTSALRGLIIILAHDWTENDKMGPERGSTQENSTLREPIFTPNQPQMTKGE